MSSTSRIRLSAKPQPSAAAAIGHWGELLQGRLGADGPVALVTLRCPFSMASARFWPAPGAPLLVSGRLGGLVATRAARLALDRLGAADLGGRLLIEGSAPPRVGAGSSTLSALTSLRAVASSLGCAFDPATEAALCLAAEGASDPLMLAEPMRRLWASREGRALDALPPPPPMTALALVAGPGARTDPSEADFEDISDLLALYRQGAERRDLALVGRVATESAERRQGRRPLPLWRDLRRLAEETGAKGIARAHTGSAAALLFEPTSSGIVRVEAVLLELGIKGARRFDPAGPARKAAARG